MLDLKVSKADRGVLRRDYNLMKKGRRSTLRVPEGKVLAHRRGYEARKGYGYEHADLQTCQGI